LAFAKNANFFAENRQKWQKIVIITSTPDSFTLLFFDYGLAYKGNLRETAKSNGTTRNLSDDSN
jgi:hypothetical protein